MDHSDHSATDQPAEVVPARPEVVRARRFELVDEDGRVRVVVGELGPERGDGDGIYGVAVLDREGRERLAVGLAPEGPFVVLDEAGNIAVHLGVADPTPDALCAGAFLVLNDRAGRPAIAWYVEDDGTVTVRAGSGSP